MTIQEPPALRCQSAIELTVIVPTLNEAENVPVMIGALHEALDGQTEWEVVFVDDNSPDGTAEIVKDIAQTDPRVRCIHRMGRRGLSTAVIEGAMSSAAQYIAVIDADMQHDETRLSVMLKLAREEALDVVVGSRYAEGGGLGEWDASRVQLSKRATQLAYRATGVKLKDPMSGFFLIRRDVFNSLAPDLSAMGFKILLDLFATSRKPLKFREVPFEFRTRRFGDSKLDNQAAWDFLMLLADKTVGRYVPVRFISFGLIGGLGALVHLAVMFVAKDLIGQSFLHSKIWAVAIAIVFNYALNNLITYRDRSLKGWKWVTGLLSFAAVCALGAFADIGISSYIYNESAADGLLRNVWVIPASIGIIVGAVWNYAVSSVYTWRSSK
ncbi:MAG: dolichol monophosphate mannose synthase [Hirschia sp.]|nr:dolichol monophosphate mannose synthase [Hirschia sp.]MBF17606.1 dolichol monophosphate mannose synthase [Hirschia sp.]